MGQSKRVKLYQQKREQRLTVEEDNEPYSIVIADFPTKQKICNFFFVLKSAQQEKIIAGKKRKGVRP